ncbi:hypothetical protein EN45_044090 [Penicillium chrysogenum]|uniref:Uncharacterized protein n=1 Tax=Penicillium chrysogenum TaxID=5076 RepID=A0A167YJZ0_PENCH|nr:hypothetical protein EN45_044090 [Penicillium chrysogenum]
MMLASAPTAGYTTMISTCPPVASLSRRAPRTFRISYISLVFLARPKNNVSETLGMRALICHSPREVALSGPQWLRWGATEVCGSFCRRPSVSVEQPVWLRALDETLRAE